MADTYLNRVKMTVSGTPDTGTATLNAASTGYVAFASGDGGKTFSILWEDTGNAWEIATGCTYTHSGTTLTRGTRVGSSSGSALSLTSAATATVIVDAAALNTFAALIRGTKTLGRAFTALDNNPPETNFATLDTLNSISQLNFTGSGSTNIHAVFQGVIQEGADLSSGIKVRIFWRTTATTGSARWGAQFERGNTAQSSDSWDTATEVTTATGATANVPNITEITCTAIDSLVAGDFFRVRISRDLSDVADDITVACSVIAVELQQVA